MTSTPVASAPFGHCDLDEPRFWRRRQPVVFCGEVAQFGIGGRPAHAGEPAFGIVGQVPRAVVTASFVKSEAKGLLNIGTGGERKRIVQSVTQPAVDIPNTGRMFFGRQPADAEHQVVPRGFCARGGAPVHSADVSPSRVAERVQQRAERAVQVIAISAATFQRDTFRRVDGIDTP